MTELHCTYELKNISFFVEFLVKILIPIGGARKVGLGKRCQKLQKSKKDD